MSYYQIRLLNTYRAYRTAHPVILSTIKKQSCYIAIIAVCWLPDFITGCLALAQPSFDRNHQQEKICIDLLASSQAVLLALAFFYQNKVVRDQWYDLLSCCWKRTKRGSSGVYDVSNEIDYVASSWTTSSGSDPYPSQTTSLFRLSSASMSSFARADCSSTVSPITATHSDL